MWLGKIFAVILFLSLAVTAFAQQKQIIVLALDPNQGGVIRIGVVFWFAVPLARRVPTGNLNSAYTAATSQELSDISNGVILEEFYRFMFPRSYSKAQIQTIMESFYADRLAWLAAQPFSGQHFGLTWDGTNWSP